MSSTRPRRRRRYTRAQRQEFLALYRRSGLSASAFVGQHDIKLSTLYQWMHRVKLPACPSVRGSVSIFKEVLIPGSPLIRKRQAGHVFPGPLGTTRVKGFGWPSDLCCKGT